MEPEKPSKIPRPESELPPTERPVVRPTLERVISSRVDSRSRSVAFDNEVLKNMGEGMYTVDLNGEVTSLNRSAEIMFGWTFAQIAGRNMHNITHYRHSNGELFPESECASIQVLRTGETLTDQDDVFVRKDGTFFDVICSTSPIREKGEIKGLVVVFRDVTERNQILKDLHVSEERFRLAQDAGNVGVWDWDIAAGTTYWSETMWRIYDVAPLDIDPDEAFWASRIHPNDRGRATVSITDALNSEDVRHKDMFRILKSDGGVSWIESMATIQRDEAGKAVRMYGVDLDITEKKAIEERIRRNEGQLRVITNSVPALISYIDKDRIYRFVNERYTEWFGTPASEITGRHMRDVIGAKSYRILKTRVDEVLSGQTCNMEMVIDYPAVGERFVQFSYTPDIAEDGETKGFYVLISDLTDRKHAEDQLRTSEERMRVLMWSLTEHAILSIDLNGKIDAWNRGAELIFGYPQEEIMGSNIERLFTPEDAEMGVHIKEMRKARHTGHAADDRWHIRKDGSRFFASGEMTPVYVGETLIGYAKIVRDLTQTKRIADELQAAHDDLEMRVADRTHELESVIATLVEQMEQRAYAEEQRLKLLRRLFTVQEDERGRIARDIHDQLGQRLTALRLKIASLKDMSTHEPEVSSRIDRLQEIAEHLDTEVSFLAWQMRPGILENTDFVQTLENFVTEWSRHSEIFAEFDSIGVKDVKFDDDLATNLYRITQEALNNAAKHAKANRINVLLEKRDEQVILIIEDNGGGFDTNAIQNERSKGKGFGLFGMRERASLISGTIEIESAVGQGTSIFVRVPLK